MSNKLIIVGSFHNLGDAFLAEAEATFLRGAACGAAVTLAIPEIPSEAMSSYFKKQGIGLISVTYDIRKFLALCARSDLFIGGGRIIRENVSTAWLFLLMLGCYVARARGRQVLVVGSGLGPVTSGLKIALWNNILAQCGSIGMRDARAAERLAQLFPSNAHKIRLTNDVAFLGEVLPTAPVTVTGICLISPAHDSGEGRKFIVSDVVQFVSGLESRGLISGVQVVAHDPRPAVDGELCERLAAQLRDKLAVPVECLVSTNLADLVDRYRESAFVITGRLHGLIIGAIMRRPVFYFYDASEKLAPFAQRFGFKCVNLNEGAGCGDLDMVANMLHAGLVGDFERVLRDMRAEAAANFE